MFFLSLSQVIDRVSADCWDNIAVKDLKQTLTYGELKTLSDNVSGYFQHHPQYKKGGIVLLHIEKTVYLPVVLLGILKAGLAYIPLSEFHSDEQICSISLDSQASILLTDSKILKSSLVEKLALPVCHLEEVLVTSHHSQLEFPDIVSTDLAYILYTSGSTGKPKGVMIEHGQLAYYSEWFSGQSWGDSAPSLPFTSAVSFAAAVSQIYYSLRRGEVLHILPEDCLRTPKLLLNWYHRHPNAALYCVPTVWRELLAFFALMSEENHELALPNVVLLSGEAVPEALKTESFQIVPTLRLYNLYGPTEATANATFCELYPEIPVHLGQGIIGTEILLLDEQKKPVVKGEIGELYIAGHGVARGYLNDLERTKQRFCSLYSAQGQWLWAHGSGDLVKMDENDRLIYLGRKDSQLKLNGIRFDAGDIEQAICLFPGVSACIVTVYQSDNGIQSLVAYVLCEQGEPLDNKMISHQQWREFLHGKLTDSLLPTHFICLNTFPKLPNGKLDKSQLPQPQGINKATSQLQDNNPEPCINNEDTLEQAIFAIWEQVLACGTIARQDNMMALGANSLHLMRVQSLIESQLGYVLSFNDFFDYPSIKSLVNKLKSMPKNQQPAKEQRETSSAFLSHEQVYFMTLDCFSENTDYQIYFYHEIKGILDTACLKDSLFRCVKHNPILLTRFNLDMTKHIDVPFTLDDITIIEKKATLAQVEDPQWLLKCAQSVCTDLDSGPLIHFQLLSIEDDFHVLLHTVHHVVFDRESINIWSQKLIEYYQYLKFDKSILVEQESDYKEYINDQQILRSQARDEALNFWRNQLQYDFTAWAGESIHSGTNHCVESQALHGYKANKVQLLDSQQHESLFRLDYRLGLLVDIEAYAQRHNVTVSMIMLTAFYLTLLQTNEKQFCQIGIPVSNRERAGFSQTLGCFVNMINFCVDVQDHLSFTDLLTRCRSSFFKRLPYAYMSYGELVDDYRQEHNASVIPFLANFNYLTPLPRLNVGNTQWTVQEIQPNAVRQGIMLTVEEKQDTLLGYLCFDIQQYSNEDISFFSRLFEKIINDEIYSESFSF
ncbi:non-ribosomal peptide synthetase [uncultured Shewanella sp.]|uniref:non-ribosomal peptide synthetase n=1 Tax=uncultured Shewanella sp. TaxID=173975 RepID=UPI00260EB5FE|nr:non-ribosomal peptide synthetase [uncultured Shewanella sp.]